MLRHILPLSALLLFSCSNPFATKQFASKLAPGATKPTGKNLIMTYLVNPDVSVSKSATGILENLLNRCGLNSFTPAAETEEILQANNITIPRRLSQNFVKSLAIILRGKYVLIGAVTLWEEGSIGFPASSTEIQATFMLYSLETGEVIWTVSGQEEGGGGIFAESPETKARVVFLTMLKKWPGLCKGIQ